MVYMVSYDLRAKPEDEYIELDGWLRQQGAVRVLYSQWVLESEQSAATLRDLVCAHVEDDDRVLVTEIVRPLWAGHRLMVGASDFIKKHGRVLTTDE